MSNLSFFQEPGAKLRWERDPFGPDHYLEVNAILRPGQAKVGSGSNQVKAQYHDSIICLPGEPIGCEYLRSEPWKEGGVFMSTYEEFMVLLTMGLLIVAILNYMDHKK